jgi:hypothetical protein
VPRLPWWAGATVEVVERPPIDPDDWSDEEWQAFLQATAAEVEADGAASDEGAVGYRKLRQSAGGSVLGAAMLGIEQAIYGERPKEEVVVEADSDDPNRDLSLYDPDDPRTATISLAAEPREAADDAELGEPGRPTDPGSGV